MSNQKFISLILVFNISTFLTNIFAQSTLLKARYVNIPYELIDDARVPIVTADYNFIRSQPGETKINYYASFDIDFTSDDSLQTFQKLKKDTRNFADNFQDTTLFYQTGGKAITLNEQINPQLKDKPLGSFFSFIKENEIYIGKVKSKNPIPDSLHARHILFNRYSDSQIEKALNDLKNNSITWENAFELYNKFQMSIGENGDLGYLKQGVMVESFDKLCFDTAVVGEYYKVETPFGMHIVQVLDKKISGNTNALQTLCYVSKIFLSTKTVKENESKVQKIAGNSKNIDELEKKMQLENIAFKTLEQYYELPYSEIGKWIKSAKNGDITLKPLRIKDISSNKELFILLGTRIVQTSELSDDQIMKKYGSEIISKKKKEFIINDLKKYKTLESIASTYKVKIKNTSIPGVKGITSEDEMISGLNLENKLMDYKQNELTGPLIGFNGVYIAYIYWKKPTAK